MTGPVKINKKTINISIEPNSRLTISSSSDISPSGDNNNTDQQLAIDESTTILDIEPNSALAISSKKAAELLDQCEDDPDSKPSEIATTITHMTTCTEDNQSQSTITIHFNSKTDNDTNALVIEKEDDPSFGSIKIVNSENSEEQTNGKKEINGKGKENEEGADITKIDTSAKRKSLDSPGTSSQPKQQRLDMDSKQSVKSDLSEEISK